MTAFLLLHGWQNYRPRGHWMRETAETLRAQGATAEYPQLPDADEPTVAGWSTAAAEALHRLEGQPVVVVAHSLGAALWLGARPGSQPVERVLLVATPALWFLAGEPALEEFGRLPRTASDVISLVGSDDDPCSNESDTRDLAEDLGLPLTIISGAGHFTPDSGYGDWPSVVAWCQDPSTALVARNISVS